VPPADEVDELELFRRYRQTRSRALRNELVERNMELAEPHVRRYAGKGIADADLRQAALLGMLGAVERFDPEMGVAFATFASRTMDGELKRQLRDKSWLIRPPRRHQEVFLAVRKAEEELEQRLGRSPRVDEIAQAVGESTDAVLEALEAGGARRPDSLDHPDRSEPTPARGHVGATADLNAVEVKILVRGLLDALEPRERAVVEMRFFEEMPQPEIAERLGLSQSYVSRLIRRVLIAMRDDLGVEAPGDDGPDDEPH
jgi:RNA polymerase sigma-B factor